MAQRAANGEFDFVDEYGGKIYIRQVSDSGADVYPHGYLDVYIEKMLPNREQDFEGVPVGVAAVTANGYIYLTEYEGW